MRKLIILSVSAGLGLVCANDALAQKTPPNSASASSSVARTEDKETGKPDIAGRPVIIPPDTAKKNLNLPPSPKGPSKNPIPPPPDSVKALVKDFQEARHSFLLTQEQLRRKLKEATDEQRAEIRALLKENLANWIAEQRSRVRELRDQARDIKDKVPSISDVVDSARGEGRGR